MSEHNFTLRGDTGAVVYAMVDGRPVVDLWRGYMDDARTRLWERDTLVQLMSTSKEKTGDDRESDRA